jgi:hypothetical protein
VQCAPSSTFATVSHVLMALAIKEAFSIPQVYLTGDGNSGTGFLSIEMPQAFSSVLCQLNTIKDENDTRPIQFPDTYVAGSWE